MSCINGNSDDVDTTTEKSVDVPLSPGCTSSVEKDKLLEDTNTDQKMKEVNDNNIISDSNSIKTKSTCTSESNISSSDSGVNSGDSSEKPAVIKVPESNDSSTNNSISNTKKCDSENKSPNAKEITTVSDKKAQEKVVTEMECDDKKPDEISVTDTLASSRPSTRSSSTQKPSLDVTPSGGRATRSSQNPDFAAKHRKFLNRVHDAISKSDEAATDESSSSGGSPAYNDRSINSDDSSSSSRHRASRSSEKRRRESVSSNKTNMNDTDSEEHSIESDSTVDSPKRKKFAKVDPSAVSKLQSLDGSDRFCWRCHREGNMISCKTCPRSYHMRCTQLETAPQSDWVCPECTAIVYAENVDTRSPAMKSLSLDQLCNLLKYTLTRMKSYVGSEWFGKPVDQNEFPEYRSFVIRPMDLALLEKNIKQKRYGSTEAFLADTKWILHNCIVFNTYQSKLTNIAKTLAKICKQEMAEIENCPDCYLNAHTRKDSWFIEVCRRPHPIVWAKLKGFPFWPAKAMQTNSENHVDVRFFGAHDRAWVPVSSVYLYSRNPPTGQVKNKKKNNLDECIMEVEQHIKKLRDKFGKFEYAPFKTVFDPEQGDEQLHVLLPHYNGSTTTGRRQITAFNSVKSIQNLENSDLKNSEVKEVISDENKKIVISFKKKTVNISKNSSIEKMGDNESSNKMVTVDSTEPLSDHKEDDTGKKDDGKFVGVAEPNLVYRGVTVKRRVSAVYDGGGDGISRNANSDCCDDKSEKGDISGVISKQRRINSDNTLRSVDSVVKNSDNSSNISVSDNSLRSSDEISLLSNKKEITITRKDAVNISRTSNRTKSTENSVLLNEQKQLSISLKNLKNITLTSNVNYSERSNSPLSLLKVSTNINNKENKEKSDGSLLSKDNCSKDNSNAKSRSDMKHRGEDSSNISGLRNIENCDKQPIVVLCDLRKSVRNTESFTDLKIKKEIISDEENETSVSDQNQMTKESFLRKYNLTSTIKSVNNDKTVGCVNSNEMNEEVNFVESNDNKSTEQVSSLLCNQKKSAEKYSTALNDKVVLDSSDDGGSVLVIDENLDNEQGKNQPDKSPESSESESSLSNTPGGGESIHEQILKSVLDTSSNTVTNVAERNVSSVLLNRRKSKPVKIRSRSNTSSSEDTVEELKRICEEQESFRRNKDTEPLQTVEEVLDEVSGRFRRKDSKNSDDPNVTITLISDDDQPKKPVWQKTKDIQNSVSLSRDVSLSIVDNSNVDESAKELPTILDMECVESDTEEPVLVNETRLKPTARKSFPRPVTPNTGNKNENSSQNINVTTNKGFLNNKKDIQITPVTDVVKTSNKAQTRSPPNVSILDEIKISNTMSLKLQATTTASTTVVNGNVVASSPSLATSIMTPSASSSNTSRTAATTQPRTLPQLLPKPPPTPIAVPTGAILSGPTSAQINTYSEKLAHSFKVMIEEMLHDLSKDGSTEATIKSLQLEIERMQWKHRQEVAELKHNTDLIIMEMRASLEAEKHRVVMETKMKCRADKETAVNETKTKQWCALCKKEALFYCCWNTAYCNYPCQEAHWPQHMSVCAQTSRSNEGSVTKINGPPSKNIPPPYSSSNTNKNMGYTNPSTTQQLAPVAMSTDNLAPSVFYSLPVGLRMNSSQV